MKDLTPFPCCHKNKQENCLTYRTWTGLLNQTRPHGYYFYSFAGNHWTKAIFCPFCGKNVEKISVLLND
jgi:hypothetical protein